MKKISLSLLIISFFVIPVSFIGAKTLPTINTNNPNPNNSFTAFGDSFTYGLGANPISNSYINRLANSTGWNLTNLGVSGATIPQINTDSVYNTDVERNNIFTILAGFNDMRIVGGSDTALTQYEQGLRASLVWLGIPNSKKIFANDTGTITYTGTWTNFTQYGVATGRYASVSGSTATVNLSGTAIYLGFASVPGNSAVGKFRVTIDENEKGIIDGSEGDSSGGVGAFPGVVRYGDLSNGTHTVVITALDNRLSFLDFFASNEGLKSTTGPQVFAGNVPRMTESAYAGSAPYNKGSNAIVAEYNKIHQSVINDLSSDGLHVVGVEVSRYFNPDTSDLSTDTVHPSNIGHEHLFRAFFDKINPPLTTPPSTSLVSF